MPLTPQITITGNLQQVTGVINSGSVQFELVNFGSTVPRVSGTAILVVTSFQAQADGSGNFSVTLWGTDVVTPSGVFYAVTFYSDTGAPVMTLPYQFVGTGTFDLSQVIPMGQTVIVAAPQPTSAVPQIFTPITHQFLTGMNSSGLFSSAQPAFTDISGSVAASQLPLPTASTLGGVKSLAAVTHKFITSIGTDGVPVAAQPTLSDIGAGALSSTTGTFTDILTVTGNASLPAATGSQVYWAGGYVSPVSGRLFIGDGTGWKMLLSKRTASTTTDLFTFQDNGNMSLTGQYQVSGTQIAASNLSNGTTGSGAIVLANTPTLITPVLGAATGTSLVLTGAITTKSSVTFQTASGTLGATITNDTAGGITATNNAGKQVRLIDATGALYVGQSSGAGILFFGATSGNVTVVAQSVAGTPTMTWPATSGNIVIDSATQTLTSKTLTTPTISSPVISGTITSYNGITTSGIGTAIVIGTSIDLVASTSTSSGNLVASAPVSGMYQFTVTLTGIGVNGGASGGTATWTVAGIAIKSVTAGAGGSATDILNSPFNSLTFSEFFSAGAAITYSVALSGTGSFSTPSSFPYTLHIRTELIG